jgi:hypothetical protein
MVQKLSAFLGTSFSETPVDSAGVRAIVQSETIKLDSGTSGNYIRSLTGGPGFNLPAAAHSLDGTLTVDSSYIALLDGTQTLTNKTLNLTNNTLTGTLGQFNAALSGDDFVGLNTSQTLTNKTLTSPTITGPTITGPGSITDISTFGLRDVTTTTYETRIRSNNVSPVLSADRTLTFDVNNADRNISLTGDLTLGGSFTTSGAHNTTLTTSGTTSLTLPTSGTVVTKDGSGNFSAGLITADFDRSGNTTVSSGTYGSASLVPVLTVDASGFIDSIGTVSVAGVSSVSFDSASYVYTINTADGGTYPQMTHTRLAQTAGTFGSSSLVPVIKVDEFGHVDSIGTVSVAGVSTFTFDSAQATLNIGTADGGSFNARIGLSSFSTTDLSEGTNQYHTTARVRNALSVSGDLSYDSSTGQFSFDETYSTANELLTAIKTVDGATSGLDADLLDGQHGSHYRIDVYDASGTLLN